MIVIILYGIHRIISKRTFMMEHSLLSRSVGDLVKEDFRTAAVFETLGIDFCCGGAQTLEAACAGRGIATETMEKAIQDALRGVAEQDGSHFARMDTAVLVDHILTTHHTYLRRVMPSLVAWSAKVANAHGEKHPETQELAVVVASLCAELEQHMFKEERILFPAILAQAAQNHEEAGTRFAFGSLGNPIAMMEQEHRDAGDGLAAIRRLSGDFVLPADACATFTALYLELEAFERDLHMHIHLENNILFPKALQSEKLLPTR